MNRLIHKLIMYICMWKKLVPFLLYGLEVSLIESKNWSTFEKIEVHGHSSHSGHFCVAYKYYVFKTVKVERTVSTKSQYTWWWHVKKYIIEKPWKVIKECLRTMNELRNAYVIFSFTFVLLVFVVPHYFNPLSVN